MSEQTQTLSAEGRTRREAILRDAIRVASRRRLRRRGARGVAVLGAVLAAGIGVYAARSSAPTSVPRGVAHQPQQPVTQVAHTSRPAITIRAITEDELLARLHAEGIDAGYIRVGDEVRVVIRGETARSND